MKINLIGDTIEGIPLLCAFEGDTTGRKLVVWLTGFSGGKEAAESQLIRFARNGFVGLSFDPYQHNARRVGETNDELIQRVISNIRRHFWPILARTAEETPGIIDWAIRELKVDPDVRMGGISMGGDIAVAAAGLDPRIVAVAALIATPDWLRPGSHEPPGEADSAAWDCYHRVNPLTHLERYAHAPAILFECGANDTQVPADGALRFAAALESVYAAHPERLRVTLREGVGHQVTEEMLASATDWFRQH